MERHVPAIKLEIAIGDVVVRTDGDRWKQSVNHDERAAAAKAVSRRSNLALTHMWNGPGCKIFLWLNEG